MPIGVSAVQQRPCTPTAESRSVMIQRLSAAGDGQRWAASYLGRDSASILSAGSKDLESSNRVRAGVANREAKS
jgi:hypothetical protein